MRGAIEQRLMFMLAVDIDQLLADLLEHLQRDGEAIHPRPGAPVVGHNTAQQAQVGLIFVPQFVLLQPGTGERLIGGVKTGRDVRAASIAADHALVRTVAHGQAQRPQHDGLAGTGFAGNDRHAWLKLDVERVDDGVVANGELSEHGGEAESG